MYECLRVLGGLQMSCQRWKVGWGLAVPPSSPEGFHSLSVSGKEKQKTKENCRRERERDGGSGGEVEATSRPPPLPTSVLSLIVVVFLLFAIRQRGTGADLPVAVQPLLHHLGDKRVVAAAGALLKSHQDSTLRHTAVQPLPQQLLLLLFITHLQDRDTNYHPEGAM